MSKNKSFSVGKIARVQSWNKSSSAKFLGKSLAIKIVLIKLEVLVRSISKTELHQGYFPIHSLNFQYSFFFGTPMNRSRTIEPKKKLPPTTLILTLTVSETLTLTGGDFPRGQFSGHPCEQLFIEFQQTVFQFMLLE